uniref:Putative ovule protein n=1 Tax=Solanum chacoense TaxID=4108 RepID=A0A0V0H1D5_SOLCH
MVLTIPCHIFADMKQQKPLFSRRKSYPCIHVLVLHFLAKKQPWNSSICYPSEQSVQQLQLLLP